MTRAAECVPAPGERLSRRERLRGRDRIDELFLKGRVARAGCLMARALPSDAPWLRVAFLVGKKTGGAVIRNRLRRRLRALYRRQKMALHGLAMVGGPMGFDVAVLPRQGAAAASAEKLGADLREAILRACQAAE